MAPKKSLARAHYERTLAEKEAQAAPETGADGGDITSHGTVGERMAALMAMQSATLKGIKSRQAKIEVKRDYLPEYEAYVEGVIAADVGAQDDVLIKVMIWRIDVGDFDGALEIAAYAIRHGLATPDGFNRDIPATVLEEIAESALQVLGAGNDASGFEVHLTTAMELVDGADMPDQVRAKAHKALGLIVKDVDPAQAIEHFEAALALDEKCGVKTELGKLKKAAETTS